MTDAAASTEVEKPEEPASPVRPLRVVVSSYWYPVAVCRYLERALRRLRDTAGRPLQVVTVGPSSGPGIPWGPRYRFPQYAFAPDFRLPTDPREARVRAVRLVRRPEFLEGGIDLWIDVCDGYFVDAPIPFPRVILGTDPHVRPYARERDVGLQPGNRFVSMQTPYAREGEAWVPYGFDEECHFEEPRGVYPFDATILGAQYPNRVRLAQELRARGLRVLSRMGDLYDECRTITCAAPVAIVFALAEDLPCRVFESLAMGRTVLASRVPDMQRAGLVLGGAVDTHPGHLETFSGHGEAIEKALLLARDPFRARQIAIAGRDAAWAPGLDGRPSHGWTSRAAWLLELGGVKVAPGWVPSDAAGAAETA